MEGRITLYTDQNLEELKELLQANGRQEEYAGLENLLSSMDRIEEQYKTVLAELQIVKGEVEKLQDRGIVAGVKGIVHEIGRKAAEVHSLLIQAKESLSEGAAKLVRAVQEKGAAVLGKTLEVLQCKRWINGLKTAFGKCREAVQEGSRRLADMGAELRAAKTHVRNAGRAMKGKEKLSGGLEEQRKTPLDSIGRAFAAMEKQADKAVQALDAWERKGPQEERYSVKGELDKLRRERAGSSKAPTPVMQRGQAR